MADSASFGWSFQVTKDGDTVSDSASSSYTPASIYKGVGVVQSIPNSWTALTWGAATTVKRFAIKNLSGAATVDIATANDGTGIFATIPAGESLPPMPTKSSATYYAKSSTGSVTISKDFDGAS